MISIFKHNWMFGLALSVFICLSGTLKAKAEQNLVDLMRQLDQTSIDEDRLSILYDISYLLHKSEPQRALEFIEKAETLAKEKNFKKDLAKLYYVKAKIFRQIGEHKNAAQHITNSLNILEKQEQKATEEYANSLNVLGWLFFDKGDFAIARSKFKEGKKLAEELNDSLLLAININDIGTTFHKQGIYEEAASYYTQASGIREKLKNEYGLMMSYNNLGVLYRQMRDVDQALLYYEKGLAIAKKLDDKMRIISLYNNIGNIYRKQKEYQKAANTYAEGLTIVKEINAPSRLALFEQNIGINYIKQDLCDQAIPHLENGLQIYQELGEEANEAVVLQALGNAFAGMNDHTKALEYYLTTNEIAKRIEFGQILEDLSADIARSYRAQKDYQKAYLYQKRHLNLLKERLSTENIKAIKNLEARYAAEDNLKEQKQQVAYLNQEWNHQQSKFYYTLGLLALLGILVIMLFLNNRKKQETNKILSEKQAQIILKHKALEEKNKELEIAKDIAEKAAKAKEEFLSTMSHEIRTPMNAVVGMTNILIDDDPRQDQLSNLKTLKFSANNLLTLINDILDFSKIESGKVNLEKVNFSLQELTRNIHTSFKVTSEKKNVKILLDTDAASLDRHLIGDSTRLTQILSNLVGNAIKFTKVGSVSIVCKLLDKNKDSVQIYFGVKDTGIGIPEDRIEAIFESFTQAMSNTTRIYGGTGLGLAITKRLVELHDAKVRVDSEVGKGSTFYFTIEFPLGTKLGKKMKPENASLTKEGLEGIRILMAEDNKINQLVARKILSKWKIMLDIAEDGREAVEMVAKNNYDLVLMDIHMPNMDGYDATVAIRNMKNLHKRNIPIIALTASAFDTVSDKAIELGMNDHMGKPFKPADLFNKISYCIANHRAEFPTELVRPSN